MKGLEPSTFCMAKAGGRSRPFASVRRIPSLQRLLVGRSNVSEPERTRSAAIAAIVRYATLTVVAPSRKLSKCCRRRLTRTLAWRCAASDPSVEMITLWAASAIPGAVTPRRACVTPSCVYDRTVRAGSARDAGRAACVARVSEGMWGSSLVPARVGVLGQPRAEAHRRRAVARPRDARAAVGSSRECARRRDDSSALQLPALE
jgi:hypothetical protein